MLQGDISKNAEFQHKNGCKGHQSSNLKWHYIKKLVTRSTICVENFILVSQTACTGLILCCSTNTVVSQKQVDVVLLQKTRCHATQPGLIMHVNIVHHTVQSYCI